MPKFIKYIGLLIFLHMSFLPAYSQTDSCASVLSKAGKLYEEGKIDEIPALLAPCMAEGFTRNQKIEAYKLIILVYLFDDDQVNAENTMVEFLKKYPEYEIMPNDPVEFVYLFNSYRTTSIFSLNMSFGTNLASPRIIEPFSTADMTNTKISHSIGAGFVVNLGISRDIAKKLTLNLDLVYSTSQYKFKESGNFIVNGVNINSANLSFAERLEKIDIPLTAVYDIRAHNLYYFLRSGIGYSRILKANGIPNRQFDINSQPVGGGAIDITGQRIRNSIFLVMGGGLKYKVPRGYLVLDARLNIGVMNIVNSPNRDNTPEIWARYQYIDSDFALNTLYITFGYHFSFYQPKKQR